MRIALVTARAAVDLDPDLEPLAAALGSAGADTAIVSWDETDIEWTSFDAAVVRSAWDYPERLAEFTEWIHTTARATNLLNPPEILGWNTNKRYLTDLAKDGVPVVPTRLVAPGEPLHLPPGDEIVVKPSVSAGSRDTARFERDDPALVRLATRIHDSGRTVMLQPYLAGIDEVGEHALVWFDGEYSHAFRKGPILRLGDAPTTSLFAEEEITATVVGDREIEVARKALSSTSRHTGALPTYARVDLVPGPGGDTVVLELELVEPSVYHDIDPESAGRFADAILRRAGGRTRDLRPI